MYLELQFCNAHGIPHSTFLGAEKSSPLEWLPSDRSKALAFELEKSLRCQMCGTAPWEWELDPYAYEAGLHQCRGCYVQESMSSTEKTGSGQRVVLLSTKGEEAKRRRQRDAEMSRRDRATGNQ